MKQSPPRLCSVFRSVFGSVIAVTIVHGVFIARSSASTTAPSDTASDTASNTAAEATTQSSASAHRTVREIVTEMASDQKAVNAILGPNNAALKSPAERTAVAPKLLPLVHRMHSDLGELTAAQPQLIDQVAGAQLQVLSLLSAIGDSSATDQIAAMARSADPVQSVAGQAHQLMVRFYVTDNSAAAQSPLVDDVATLDHAHADSAFLTQMTLEMSNDATAPEIKSRLMHLAADDMNNPLAMATRAKIAERKAADDEDAALPKSPFALTGTLVDGTPFSTAQLKGKVVLVDFWATWCVPCREELPRVKKMYADYHDKGLEVVGVSNDYDVEALKDFVVHTAMPWPELFDPKAAAAREWNSITTGQKIDSIPKMYLIDKKGVLRSVNARLTMEEMIPQLLSEAE